MEPPALIIGTAFGAVAGFFRGPVDVALMRLTDAFLCFPQLFVLIVFGTLMRTTELRVLPRSPDDDARGSAGLAASDARRAPG